MSAALRVDAHSITRASLTEREVRGGHAHSVISGVGAGSSSRGGVAVTPRGSASVKQVHGTSRSVSVARLVAAGQATA